MTTPEERPELNDAPPLLGTWRNIYLLVVGTLLVWIVLMSVFAQVYG